MPSKMGKKIRDLRLKEGLSQKDLAKILGCGQTTVAGWESKAQRLPSKPYLIKLTQIFNVSLDYLLNMKVPTSPTLSCYGAIKSKNFIWPDYESSFPISVSSDEYAENRFALSIADNYMEPAILKNDCCIFEKRSPRNGDIVVLHFLESNKGVIRFWQEIKNSVLLSSARNTPDCDNKLYQINQKKNNEYTYINEAEQKCKFIIKGVLMEIKRTIKK